MPQISIKTTEIQCYICNTNQNIIMEFFIIMVFQFLLDDWEKSIAYRIFIIIIIIMKINCFIM